LPDRDFDALFTKHRAVDFAYHGELWLIRRLTYRHTNHGNMHRRGYKEAAFSDDVRPCGDNQFEEHAQLHLFRVAECEVLLCIFIKERAVAIVIEVRVVRGSGRTRQRPG
jgi:phosphoketolase